MMRNGWNLLINSPFFFSTSIIKPPLSVDCIAPDMQDYLQDEPDDHERDKYRVDEIYSVHQRRPLEIRFIVGNPAIREAIRCTRMAFPAPSHEICLHNRGVRPLRLGDIMYPVAVGTNRD